jgi:hypothetical protein
MVPPIRVRVPSAKVAQGGAESVEAPGVVSAAVARVYQAPLFSAAMVSRADFSPAVVFKMVATMCERGSSTATNAMKTEVHLEPVVDTEEDTVREKLVREQGAGSREQGFHLQIFWNFDNHGEADLSPWIINVWTFIKYWK